MRKAKFNVVAAALLCACTAADHAAAQSVAVTATYRERMALLPDDVFEATLEDVTIVDVPAAVLGRVRLSSPGQPPIRFRIEYDAAQVNSTHRYSVRARILRAGRVLFITDTAQEIDPGQPAPVELLMKRVVAAPPQSAVSTAVLENTYWKLVSLGETAVVVAEGRREPYFVLQPAEHRVGGFGGCNKLLGGYQLEGERLTFSQMAGTLMACEQGMDTEGQFHAALLKVGRWRISGENLELLDAAGHSLAKFESRYLR